MTRQLEGLKFGNGNGGIDGESNVGGPSGGDATDDRMEEGGGNVASVETAPAALEKEMGGSDNNPVLERSAEAVVARPKLTESSSKRKGTAPRKLPPDQPLDIDSDSSSSSSDEGDQAALVASLLRSEHGQALRAYLARHESFDTSNMGQCVPMIMPRPPSFPDEVADFLKSPLCKSINGFGFGPQNDNAGMAVFCFANE